MFWKTVITLTAALVLAANAFAQSTIFVVRHAERADTKAAPASDPGLSDLGHVRAASLATTLKDARISTIVVTEFKRTQETAAPLAKALGISTTTIKANDTTGLMATLRQAEGNVLVIGHSNTVPEIIKSLGVTTPVSVGAEDFDNLFIVTSQQPRTVIQLHYR